MPREQSDCHACEGTGIGMFGDPNTSKCEVCHGKGYVLVFVNDDGEVEEDEDD
jgi:DnaJ-class molecular chaperone